MCEKIHSRPAMASNRNAHELLSFPNGGPEAGDTDDGTTVLNVDRMSSRTELTKEITMTAKQRMRKIKVEKNIALKVNTDAVSALQELCMARWWKIPEYHSCVKIADNHFQIECSLRGYTVKGEGWSKKEAKRQAAYNVYMVVKNQD
ncbi:uncharacterized protein LOC112694225 [Sipha flava]|uniref:Uncharacterized protein LOC112694225 n=2 Tax=Sipha flava TaxID=143950 RepID=A0A8B8GQ81_9HEMI|nr:uncharacterized protein LOC112694225 [Sipha flava]